MATLLLRRPGKTERQLPRRRNLWVVLGERLQEIILLLLGALQHLIQNASRRSRSDSRYFPSGTSACRCARLSFVSQSYHGIHVSNPPSGQIAGENGGDSQQGSCCN